MRLHHIALAFAFTASLAAGPRDAQHTPRLTLDLKAVGFAPTRYDARERRYLAFNDAGQILFAANVRDESRLVSTFHTSVFLLDAADGAVLHSVTIPSTNRRDEFFLVSGNQLLLCHEKKISVYSPALTPDRQIDLPPGVIGCGSYLPTSPNHTRFYVWGTGHVMEAMSAENFALSENWCGAEQIAALSDTVNACIARRPNRIRFSDSTHYFGDDRSLWGGQLLRASVSFLSDDALLVAKANSLIVFDREGETIFEAANNGKAFFNMRANAAPSANRFAVTTQVSHGFTSEMLAVEWFERCVLVYDLHSPSAAPIFSQALPTDGPWVWHTSEVALSRDGKQLAILTDTTLRLYDLP
jgi:hypothetical protein